MDQRTLQDIQNLVDIEAIKQLKARYCKYADSGEHPDEFAELFTETAVLDEGDDGIYTGRDSIREMYKAIWPYFKLNQHLVLNPVIEVSGDSAQGDWRLLQLCTTIHPDGDRAFWACGYYEDRYRRCEGQWKFEHVKARVHFCCDHADGWGKAPWGELLPAEAMETLGLS
jgi:hypothetical protein